MTGKRKFLFACVFGGIITIATAILNFIGKEISSEYAKTVAMIYIGYMGANTVSKLMESKNSDNCEVIGGRKFFFSIFFGFVMLAIVGSLAFTGRRIDPQLLETYSYVYLGFLYANTADKFTNQFNGLSSWLKGNTKKEGDDY